MKEVLMSKFMHYYFINSEFKLSTFKKKELTDIFKSKSLVKIKDMKNYIEVSKFGKGITHKRKDNQFYEEVKKLKVDYNYSDGWFKTLSNECRKYLNGVYQKKWHSDIDEQCSNQFHNGFEDYDSDEECELSTFEYNFNDCWFNMSVDKVEAFKEYVVLSFKEDLYFDSTGELKQEYIDDICYARQPICNEDKKNKMILYCVEEERYDLLNISSDGSICLKDEVYQEYVLNNKSIPLTTKVKMKKSLDRTIEMFNEYAYCNCDKFKYFITLTFANVFDSNKHKCMNEINDNCKKELKIKYVDDCSNYECCVKALNTFLVKIRTFIKRYNEKNKTLYDVLYLGVPEYQKNGAIHYHFLFSDLPEEMFYNVASWLDYDNVSKKRKNGLGIKYWTYGKSDVEIIKDNARVSSYCSKYMIKSFYELSESEYFDRLDKKRYYASQNLEKAKIKHCNNFDDGSFGFYSQFSRESFNTFNNSYIKKTIYQVKALNEDDVLVSDNSDIVFS